MSRKHNWPGIAAKLAALIPRDRLHPAVLAFVHGEAGKAAAERWAVAFSGGADSLALLLLLWAHWPERRGRLLALHFDHRLRGRDSAGDERFCRSVCAALGVAYVSEAWRDKQERAGGVSEAQAREARMAFFARQLARRRIRRLFLGHQLDDIAETLLMRIARGSGIAGLAAPRPVHRLSAKRIHLRPLLALNKARLTEALTGAGASWREDASNAAGDFLRNRIRLDVMPRWLDAARDRDALAGAALTRAQLEEDAEALDAWAARVMGAAQADAAKIRGGAGGLALARLAEAPRAVVRRILHLWLASLPVASDLSRQGFEVLLDKLIEARSTRFSLGNHGFAVFRRGTLTYLPMSAAHVMHDKVRLH